MTLPVDQSANHAEVTRAVQALCEDWAQAVSRIAGETAVQPDAKLMTVDVSLVKSVKLGVDEIRAEGYDETADDAISGEPGKGALITTLSGQRVWTFQIAIESLFPDPEHDSWADAEQLRSVFERPDVAEYFKEVRAAVADIGDIDKIQKTVDERSVSLLAFQVEFNVAITHQLTPITVIEKTQMSVDLIGGPELIVDESNDEITDETGDPFISTEVL